MITCPFFWIDAFNMGPFTGNPAGVCALTTWPADDCLQQIARQNGLAETAFFVPLPSGNYHLRWFTPAVEIDLCGHATLASAHVLFNELNLASDQVVFESISGKLSVSRLTSGLLALDFPSRPASASPLPTELAGVLRLSADEVVWSGQARDWLIVLADQQSVRALTPDFDALLGLNTEKIIITAPGEHVDFVSRFFAPSAGVNEDHVTGSAHCTLIPYWAGQLNRLHLEARQLSPRGGHLVCELQGDRVSIAGTATTYIRGELSVR